jgi:hypothetical protein
MADNLTPTGRQAEVWLQVPESGFLTSFGFFGQNLLVTIFWSQFFGLFFIFFYFYS